MNRRRIVHIFTAFAAVAVFAFSVCAQEQKNPLKDKCLDELSGKEGKITIAIMKGELIPLFRNTDTSEAGYEIDIVKGAAKELGVEIVFDKTAASPDELVALVADGKADLAVGKLNVTQDRASKVSFVYPYIIIKEALLVKNNRFDYFKSSSKDKTFPDFNSKLAVDDAMSYAVNASQRLPNAQVFPMKRDEIVRELKKDKLEAVFLDTIEARNILAANEDVKANYKLFLFHGGDMRVSLAVSQKLPRLRLWLNNYIKEDLPLVSLDKLYEKYAGTE